jgi:hypothetical protein
MEFMTELLDCYGLSGLDDNKEVCKGDLIELNTIDKIEDMLPEIIMYYLPCKAKIYLNDLTEKRSITILCQFLKMYNYRLARKERIINKKKIIFYKLQKVEDTKLHIDSAKTYELLFK